jgi:hypothetical protein
MSRQVVAGACVDQDETKPISFRRLEFVGVVAASVTLLCLFVGQEAQQYAAQFAQPEVAAAKMQPRFNAIDYATTASIKGGVVVIGPCDTRDR